MKTLWILIPLALVVILLAIVFLPIATQLLDQVSLFKNETIRDYPNKPLNQSVVNSSTKNPGQTIVLNETPVPKTQNSDIKTQDNNAETQGSVKSSMHNYGCNGTGAINFTYVPRKIEDIGFIEPMGLMLSQHVTPIDHQYYYPSIWSNELKEELLKDVYAPADGVITTLQSMPSFFSQADGKTLGDYRIIIHYTCTFYSIYIHVNKLSPKLANAVGQKTGLDSPMEINAGELIGSARAFDFSVHNEDVTLTGFIVPEHYNTEPWKVHTVDPFDYFTPELRNELLKKNLRTEPPLGGKIDYDIDGKLIGNWFEEGTNGYEGIKKPEYWVTHVSFSPDGIDPDHFIISLGDYGGEAKQFGAKGNSPDPKDVSSSSGIVKYELVDFEYVDESGDYWNRISYAKGLKAKNMEMVRGVVLVQLLENRKLKLESFPDKTADEVSGFTGNAVVYER